MILISSISQPSSAKAAFILWHIYLVPVSSIFFLKSFLSLYLSRKLSSSFDKLTTSPTTIIAGGKSLASFTFSSISASVPTHFLLLYLLPSESTATGVSDALPCKVNPCTMWCSLASPIINTRVPSSFDMFSKSIPASSSLWAVII